MNKLNNRSKELWQITRKIMFATLLPNSKNLKERDVLEFPWEIEENTFADQDQDKLLEEIEKVKQFWEEQDLKKTAN